MNFQWGIGVRGASSPSAPPLPPWIPLYVLSAGNPVSPCSRWPLMSGLFSCSRYTLWVCRWNSCSLGRLKCKVQSHSPWHGLISTNQSSPLSLAPTSARLWTCHPMLSLVTTQDMRVSEHGLLNPVPLALLLALALALPLALALALALTLGLALALALSLPSPSHGPGSHVPPYPYPYP